MYLDIFEGFYFQIHYDPRIMAMLNHIFMHRYQDIIVILQYT